MTKIVCMHAHCFSRVWLSMTPWTVACQVPLSMGFSRWEYLSGLPCPPPMGHGRASSQPRGETHDSCIPCTAGRFFVCLFLFLPIYACFNWRIIALQNFDVFRQTSTRISHRCTHAGRFFTIEPPGKTMSNLDSIVWSRDITLPTKVRIVKTMAFSVVMYRCVSSIIKKAEWQRIDAFGLWCWRRHWRIPWTARISKQPILKETNCEYSLAGPMLKLKLQYFNHLMGTADSQEKTLMLVIRMGSLKQVMPCWLLNRF